MSRDPVAIASALEAPTRTPLEVLDIGVPLERDEHLSDLGNARRLVAEYGERILYCRPLRTWYVWDGVRWAKDQRGKIFDLAKRTVLALWADVEDAPDLRTRERIAKHALQSESEPRIRALVALAESDPAISVLPVDLDADPWLLNVGNGTLNLKTGELLPHQPEDRITKLAPVTYDPKACLPLWDEFLDRALPDAELRTFVRRAVGYSLTGSTQEEVLFFVHGPAASGKSTFVESMKAALGDYAVTADFATFLASKGAGGASPRSDLVRLAGARFVSSAEVDKGRRMAEGLVKLLTGGDTVTARALYRGETEFVPAFKLWLVANDRPRVPDDDEPLWRRILEVPFVVPIPAEERDASVKATLRDPEIAGPAILAWAVEGYQFWQQSGLDPPEAVRFATASYREEMDPLREFVAERCRFDGEATVKADALWKAYQEFSKDAGERFPLERRSFTERLKKLGLEHNTGGRITRWAGIGLLDHA